VRTERFAAAVMGGFSAVALILAAVGLYTVLSYRISTRVREIGVRTALGADPRAVAWLVVGDALRVTLPGMVAGLAGALLASRLLRALLVRIETYDPVAIATAPFVLAAVALVATLVPARRAMRVDPLLALRSE
jgi:putative ABC transport system permease protein